jgi:predicted nucleic acid-binding protein
MKYLLDVNALLASIIGSHPNHQIADVWLAQKDLVTCPLSEMGYLRISTNPRAFNLSMVLARQGLQEFLFIRKAGFIPADLPVLRSNPPRSDAVTDFYLAELAHANGMKLATLDAGIAHAAVELIS